MNQKNNKKIKSPILEDFFDYFLQDRFYPDEKTENTYLTDIIARVVNNNIINIFSNIINNIKYNLYF